MKKVLHSIWIVFIIISLLISLTACTKKEEKSEQIIKTTMITYNYSNLFNIICEVPVKVDDNGNETPEYSFKDEKPDGVEYLRRK